MWTTLDFMKPSWKKKKTNFKYNNYSSLEVEMQLLEAIKLGRDRLRLFNTSSKVKRKTMPPEIGFPMTLTSGAFLNQKPNKETNHK